MDLKESISFLGMQAGRTARTYDKEDIEGYENGFVSLFEFTPNGCVPVKGTYEKHDNSPRMSLWCKSINDMIWPNLSSYTRSSLVGLSFPIQLHDSYTYLDHPFDDPLPGTMTFSRKSEVLSDDVVLIPDPYMLCNWGHEYTSLNPIFTNCLRQPVKEGLKRAIFAGTTTGSRDPLKNQRLSLCKWAATTEMGNSCVDAYITKVAQIPFSKHVDMVNAVGGEFVWNNKVFRGGEPLSLEHQMNYDFHLMVEGNTSRFDVWPYFSNSVVIKLDGPRGPSTFDFMFYHCLMRSGTHFLRARSFDEIPRLIHEHSSLGSRNRIVSESRVLSADLFRPSTWQTYLCSLFETIACESS
jgi:hypothetical protein